MFLHLKKRFSCSTRAQSSLRKTSFRSGKIFHALRRQPDVELNLTSLGSDVRFSGRLDPEIGLHHDDLAVYRPSFSTTCTVTVRVCPWESFDLAHASQPRGFRNLWLTIRAHWDGRHSGFQLVVAIVVATTN